MDAETGEKRRHHLHQSVVQPAVKDAARGAGIARPYVVADAEEVAHLSSYGMLVKMQAHFDWLSSASPDMPAYKEWLLFVFARLEQLNSDNPSAQPLVAKAVGQ